ncbi:MAG TPA: hypothetical protein VH062_13455 [Polyangiaceae bacterium]|nr:hypothetical protein [Polyangiaceae bacterium]
MTTALTLAARANAQGANADVPPTPATDPAGPTSAAPSPEQQREPTVLVPLEAPAPAPQPPAPTPATPTPEPQPAPADLGSATTTPPERAIPSRGPAEPPPRGLALGIELNGGVIGAARFPGSEANRNVEEAVDSTFGLSVWLGGRDLIFGISAERTGLGKDHYGTDAMGETMEASYAVDTLSLMGRYYFSKERPALYLGASIGAAMPTERTTGTRAPDGVFVTPGESYTCSANGRVGGTAAATVGVEFEIARRLALLADARAAGFLMSKSANAFGGCAPGSGGAFVGGVRLGLSYRFGL